MTVFTADLTDHLLDAFYSTVSTPEVKRAAKDALLQDGYALLVCPDCKAEAVAVDEGDEGDFTDYHGGCAENARLGAKRFVEGDEVVWDVAYTGHTGKVTEFLVPVAEAVAAGTLEVRSDLDGCIHIVGIDDLDAVAHSG